MFLYVVVVSFFLAIISLFQHIFDENNQNKRIALVTCRVTRVHLPQLVFWYKIKVSKKVRGRRLLHLCFNHNIVDITINVMTRHGRLVILSCIHRCPQRHNGIRSGLVCVIVDLLYKIEMNCNNRQNTIVHCHTLSLCLLHFSYVRTILLWINSIRLLCSDLPLFRSFAQSWLLTIVIIVTAKRQFVSLQQLLYWPHVAMGASIHFLFYINFCVGCKTKPPQYCTQGKVLNDLSGPVLEV